MTHEELRDFRRTRARTFLWRKSWSRYVQDLPDASAGELLKAICRYEDGADIDHDTMRYRDAAVQFLIISMALDDMDEAFADKLLRPRQDLAS